MKRINFVIYLFCFIFVFNFLNSVYASVEEEVIFRAFSDNLLVYELEMVYYSSVKCNLLKVYENKSINIREVEYLLNECGYIIRESGSSFRKKIEIYNQSQIGIYKKILYSRVLLDLRGYIKRYFRDWDLKYEASIDRKIYFGPDWYEVSLNTILKKLPKMMDLYILKDKKLIVIKDKLVRSDRDQLYYGLLYNLSDYNKDLYELMRGYFSNLKLIYYLRDNKLYIMLSKPAKSRENCVKTYMYLKSLLDDKWSKSIKLGEYFPKKERKYLLLLYQVLSQSEIKPFKLSEIKYVSENLLVAKGLDIYKIKVNKFKINKKEYYEAPKSVVSGENSEIKKDNSSVSEDNIEEKKKN